MYGKKHNEHRARDKNLNLEHTVVSENIYASLNCLFALSLMASVDISNFLVD